MPDTATTTQAMESDSVHFYQRLVDVFQPKIEAVDFASNATINSAIRARMLQFLVNRSFFGLRKKFAKTPEVLALSDDQLSRAVDSKHLHITTPWFSSRAGYLKLAATEYLNFWIYWLAMFLALCRFWGKGKISPTSPGSLLYGCLEGFNKTPQDYDRVESYLKTTTKEGLSGSAFFVFKSARIAQPLTASMIGSKLPEAAFVYYSAFGFLGRLNALLQHILGLGESHIQWLKRPVLTGIASEFATVRVMILLQQKQMLNATLFSTSNTIKHHLTSQLNVSAHVHHVYYNIATTNPVRKEDPRPELGTLHPLLLLPIAGTHWVWSDEDVKLMTERYGLADVRTGGIPPLFYPRRNTLKDSTPKDGTTRQYDIVIFDVTPLNLDEHNPFGVDYYYGRYETAIALITTTLEAARQAAARNGIPPLKVALKPKRKNQFNHDLRYWDDIEALASDCDDFTILDPGENIFNLFHPDAIVINRPYTSTAHLAAINGAQSLYHDPHQEITDTSVKIENLRYSSGKAELTELLCQMTKTRPSTAI